MGLISGWSVSGVLLHMIFGVCVYLFFKKYDKNTRWTYGNSVPVHMYLWNTTHIKFKVTIVCKIHLKSRSSFSLSPSKNIATHSLPPISRNRPDDFWFHQQKKKMCKACRFKHRYVINSILKEKQPHGKSCFKQNRRKKTQT